MTSLRVTLVLAAAAVAGPAATAAVVSACYGLPEITAGMVVLAAVVHLVCCGLYVLLGESLVEDGVKSFFLVVSGGMLTRWFPMLGALAISAAVTAILTHQAVQRTAVRR